MAVRFIMPICCSLVYVLVSGCEEVIDRPIAFENTNQIVVEGMLTNEKTNHLVKLTRPYKTQNENPQPVSGAIVKITGGVNEYNLVEFPSGTGRYYTPEFRAVSGLVYSLQIQYDGKVYFARDGSVPVEPLEPLLYHKVNEQYRLIVDNAGQDPNYVTHFISWKHTNECSPGDECLNKVVFYDLKTIDVNEIFKPDQEPVLFPLRSFVVRKKYSVSPAYQNFLRSLLSETRWRGGVFDVQRADVPTNLSKGAIGFFSVSSVVSDTTIILRRP